MLWQLNDPARPTRNMGGALDRASIRPGVYLPADWLRVQREQREEERTDREDDVLFPAAPLPCLAISDHYPVFLAIPRVRARDAKVGNGLVLEGPTLWERSEWDGELRRRFRAGRLLPGTRRWRRGRLI